MISVSSITHVYHFRWLNYFQGQGRVWENNFFPWFFFVCVCVVVVGFFVCYILILCGIHECMLFLQLFSIRFTVTCIPVDWPFLFLCLHMQFGARFHTRPSVLLYGHWTNKRDLPSGVADALLYSDEHPYGGCAEGSSVDPWWHIQDTLLLPQIYWPEVVVIAILTSVCVCVCVHELVWVLQVNEDSKFHDCLYSLPYSSVC